MSQQFEGTPIVGRVFHFGVLYMPNGPRVDRRWIVAKNRDKLPEAIKAFRAFKGDEKVLVRVNSFGDLERVDPDEKVGIMSGYALHIRQLQREDVERFNIDLGEAPISECVAVHGEDLGECLAAVVHLKKDSRRPLIWSDADGKGTPVEPEFAFADSVAMVLTSLFPHLSQVPA